MLPTYPEVVEKRSRLNRTRLKALARAKSPGFGDIGAHFIHEGSETDIVRVDGTAEKTPITKQSAEVDIKIVKLNEFSELDVQKYIDALAEQFAKSMTESFIKAISEGAEKVGNVVDGKGSPLTPDLMLEALERIEIDFNDDGSFEAPRMIVSPKQAERLQSLAEQMDKKDQDAKLQAVIERKRLEFRRREAGRVLAG